MTNELADMLEAADGPSGESNADKYGCGPLARQKSAYRPMESIDKILGLVREGHTLAVTNQVAEEE